MLCCPSPYAVFFLRRFPQQGTLAQDVQATLQLAMPHAQYNVVQGTLPRKIVRAKNLWMIDYISGQHPPRDECTVYGQDGWDPLPWPDTPVPGAPCNHLDM